MKLFFLLTLVAFKSFAVEIPLELFDQSKLEFTLRKIPSAFLESETRGNFIRKFTRYPGPTSPFSIMCEADYYGGSPIPSDERCVVVISDDAVMKGDEYLFTVNGLMATEMFQSLPYSQEVKKMASNELVYGQNYEGNFQNLFRFYIKCKDQNSCEFRFTPKKAY